MTDEPPEDLSKQDLWNRLRRLEQEVFPDRREILRKGAAAASLGAAGMIGRASAAPGDDGETTWGGPNNRDSWYADEVDANLVSTDDLQTDCEQPQDQTASRSLDTWYQNTYSYPLVVYVTTQSGGSDGDVIAGTGHINTSETDNEIFTFEAINVGGDSEFSSGSMIVPPNHYYKFGKSEAGNGGTLENWQESRLGSN